MDRIFQHQTSSNFKDVLTPSQPHPLVSSPISNQRLELEKAPTKTQILYDKDWIPRLGSGVGTVPTTLTTRSSPLSIAPESLYQIRLSPAAKDRAINFFLSAHVFHDSSNSRGYFEYLAPLHHKSAGFEPLSLSLNAVALAAFANTVKSSNLLNEARRNLVLAIRSVNAALHIRHEATTDSTLSAVMLLGTFETITGLGMRSVQDCDTHVAAATTLMRYMIRGWLFRSESIVLSASADM